MHRRHLPRKRVPTARLPERGLRESEDHETPLAATAYVAGERLAPDIGQSSINGAAMRSLHAAPFPNNGEGEVAEGGVLPSERTSKCHGRASGFAFKMD
jgi:hypothetical protein